MARAQIGTPKYVANKMKSKGLQRLRWYCQVCEKQCRDENGFKCHSQSESHVANMMDIGNHAKSKINDYSNQFEKDFISLLKSSHGEKKINFNRFYQEYISDKNHIHMNATKWSSLTEFVRYLASKSVITLHTSDDDDDGSSTFLISYIDNSPQAIQRKQILAKREQRQDTELNHLQQQIEAAHKYHKLQHQQQQQPPMSKQLLDNKEGKISLSLLNNNNTKQQQTKRINPLTATSRVNKKTQKHLKR